MNLTGIIKKEYSEVKEKQIIIPKGNTELIEKLMSTYSRWQKTIETYPDEPFAEMSYASAIKKIKKSKVEYTSEDITVFLSQIIKEISIEETANSFIGGIFISALINNHFTKTMQKETYLLLIEPKSVEIDYLCYKNNGAEIVIYGDTGAFLCEEMQKGIVTVYGNADLCAGQYMKGGILKLKGANSDLGEYMTGGKIYLDEDYERFLAQGFEGNETTRFGGEIYCGGKRMFPKEMYPK